MYNIVYDDDFKESLVELDNKIKSGKFNSREYRTYNKIIKCINMIKNDPFYPSLNTHEHSLMTSVYKKYFNVKNKNMAILCRKSFS